MKILAIDFGTKNIGFAMGNTRTGIAFPRDILKNSEIINPTILQMCTEEQIDKIIVGLPLLPLGKETEETKNAKRFSDELEDYLLKQDMHIPVDMFDERYSSKSARDSLHFYGYRNKNMKGKIDNSAAAIFLQTYLDTLENKQKE